MSFNLVNQMTLIFSGLGLLVLIFRKIPALLNILSKDADKKKSEFLVNLKNRIESIGFIKNFLKNFSYNIFLQKILSKVRVLTLKTENKTSSLLQKLREKTKEKLKESDTYWEKIKRIKKVR